VTIDELDGSGISLAALSSAALAAAYTFLTYRLVRSQTEPHVVVYVHHDESRPTILQIVIANIGRGFARGIAFKASRDIPSRAFGLESGKSPPPAPMQAGPLVEGVPALAPGESRQIDWGQFAGLFDCLGEGEISITCSYQDKHGKSYRETFPLEVRSFAKTHRSASDGHRIIRELEDISRHLQRLALTADRIRAEHESERKESAVPP
jgi:hypothetical protein